MSPNPGKRWEVCRWIKQVFGGGKRDLMTENTRAELPKALFWLADAPLFIDSDQVARFYDAVVRPQTKEGTTTLETTEENAKELKGTLNLEATVTTSNFASLLTPFLALVKPTIKGAVEGEGGQKLSSGKSQSIELHPVDTPQSQLEALIAYYLANYARRVFLPKTAKDLDWRDPKSISDVPRSIVFLDLPSMEQARENELPTAKLIPMAAEFDNGKIIPIYPQLTAKNGERPPDYPERGSSTVSRDAERKAYWQWFDKNFSAKHAMRCIEEVASANGRIRWIDYRLPLTSEGETLHLHICPAGQYDTGVFAYNFVNRGFTHGLRLIGTLKSGPDMNVLAICEK